MNAANFIEGVWENVQLQGVDYYLFSPGIMQTTNIWPCYQMYTKQP